MRTTYLSDPKEKMDSGFGNGITYEQYCEKEVERLIEKGCDAHVVHSKSGLVCVDETSRQTKWDKR